MVGILYFWLFGVYFEKLRHHNLVQSVVDSLKARDSSLIYPYIYKCIVIHEHMFPFKTKIKEHT